MACNLLRMDRLYALICTNMAAKSDRYPILAGSELERGKDLFKRYAPFGIGRLSQEHHDECLTFFRKTVSMRIPESSAVRPKVACVLYAPYSVMIAYRDYLIRYNF